MRMLGITIVLLLTAIATATGLSGRAVSKPPIPGSPQMIRNGEFTNGTTGWVSNPIGEIRNGQYCVAVPANTPSGNASYLRTAYTFLETKNDVYTLNFTASSTVPYDVLVRTPDPPLDPNLNRTAALTLSLKMFSMTFSPANQAPNASVEFDLGGNTVATTVCFGNISMKRIDRSGYRQDVGPAIKVNQLGYLTNKSPKRATLVTNSTRVQSWSLINESDDVCAQGRTVPRGRDSASGDNVHIIDFSKFKSAGHEYTLKVADATSFPFSISSTLYSGLYKDALRFFYQQRSGIAINGSLVGDQYARAAGHVQVPPNTGDVRVPCQTVTDSLIAYLEPWTCNYTLDVTQGWYDAGDQGKYVVNGGIAVAQLLMAYERSLYHGGNKKIVGSDTLAIPESHNGIPDILDEAKWELEFLLKMQVPQGSPPQLFNGSMIDMSGMAHHKMHDNQWTPLPTDSSQDPKRRELHRPSTAATLNLAAAAAMAARIYKHFDSDFAARCLQAATSSYAAAQRNPSILAPGTDWDLGGGAYSDATVEDEFYWAAAELYLTTSDSQYQQDIESNDYSSANASTVFSVPGGFSWASVAALGRLDLASVSKDHSKHREIVQSVTAAADVYVTLLRNESNGYGALVEHYSWGSTSNHLNNIQIVATAYDLTGNKTYLSTAFEALDYILGRNALAQSYVVGYGPKSTKNVHSRLYAHELDPSVPRAPPGSLSGGANEDASDPPADDVLQGCAPQKCYVEDVNSYSTNEVAINWNSALVWVVAWAASL
jgi:endoglucanase